MCIRDSPKGNPLSIEIPEPQIIMVLSTLNLSRNKFSLDKSLLSSVINFDEVILIILCVIKTQSCCFIKNSKIN